MRVDCRYVFPTRDGAAGNQKKPRQAPLQFPGRKNGAGTEEDDSDDEATQQARVHDGGSEDDEFLGSIME